MNHKKKLKIKPFERTLGNASLSHIVADECYGRLMMLNCYWSDRKRLYRAEYECALCGMTIKSGHNKPGEK